MHALALFYIVLFIFNLAHSLFAKRCTMQSGENVMEFVHRRFIYCIMAQKYVISFIGW